jgi:putative tricarboxylic transport membrane protein
MTTAEAGAAGRGAAEEPPAPGQKVVELFDPMHEDIPRAGPWAPFVAALAPLALGVAALLMSLQLGFGSFTEPGAGLWPTVLSVALIVGSVVVLVIRPRDDCESFTSTMPVIILGIVSLLGFALLFQRVGFEIPTLAVLVLWLKVIGRESWRTTAIVAVGTTIALYLVFILALRVNIPHLI